MPDRRQTLYTALGRGERSTDVFADGINLGAFEGVWEAAYRVRTDDLEFGKLLL